MKRMLPAALLLAPAIGLAQDADVPPLSGPPVTEERIPGVESGFSSMMAGDRARMTEPVPMNVFRRAVMELAGEDVPADIRLSPEQTKRLRATERQHREAIAAFRREHAAEYEKIREDLGPRLAARLSDRRDARDRRDRPGAQRPDQAQPDMRGQPAPPTDRPPQPPIQRGDLTETQRSALAAAARLRAQEPQAQALQTKIWAALTEPQQARVQARIDAFRAQAAERRQQAYAERMAVQLRQSQTDRPITDRAADRPITDRAGAVRVDPQKLPPDLQEVFRSLPERMQNRLVLLPQQRLERILTRFGSLTPEQREEALQRIRQRASGAQSDRRPSPDRDRDR